MMRQSLIQETRFSRGILRRLRKCRKCGSNFTTYEIYKETMLDVEEFERLKKDNKSMIEYIQTYIKKTFSPRST